MQIPIEPHDRVIAAFPWREYVLIVTESGRLYQLSIKEDVLGHPQVRVLPS